VHLRPQSRLLIQLTDSMINGCSRSVSGQTNFLHDLQSYEAYQNIEECQHCQLASPHRSSLAESSMMDTMLLYRSQLQASQGFFGHDLPVDFLSVTSLSLGPPRLLRQQRHIVTLLHDIRSSFSQCLCCNAGYSTSPAATPTPISNSGLLGMPTLSMPMAKNHQRESSVKDLVRT
jgi:hypothetical protein